MDAQPSLFEEPQFVIYKITNKKNGRAYIGMTAKGVQRRFRQHWKDSKRQDSALYRAMRKYGKKAFSITILAILNTVDNLAELEVKLISDHRSFIDDGGYNMTKGGESPIICDETRKNMRFAAKQRMADPEVRKKISASLRGRKLSQEHIAASARGRTGKPLSDTHRATLSKRQKGRIITTGWRAKIANTLHGRAPPPQAVQAAIKVNTGKVCTDATRAKISAALRSPEINARKSESMRKSWAARKLIAETKRATLRLNLASRDS